jgi:hypothetical protein
LTLTRALVQAALMLLMMVALWMLGSALFGPLGEETADAFQMAVDAFEQAG